MVLDIGGIITSLLLRFYNKFAIIFVKGIQYVRD